MKSNKYKLTFNPLRLCAFAREKKVFLFKAAKPQSLLMDKINTSIKNP